MGKRLLNRLTPLEVKRASEPGYYNDGLGLYLVIDRKGPGCKSWTLRYKIDGRSREMGLGSASVFTLAEARERALAARKMIADGVDPIDHRRKQRLTRKLAAASVRSFEECTRALHESKRSEWRSPKAAAQWLTTMETHVFPMLGLMNVADVTTEHVVRALSPTWTSMPVTAARLRQRIEQTLDYARVHGHRTGENPARWAGHLSALLPSPAKLQRQNLEHFPALPYAKIGAFMHDLREREGTAERALEFLILTCVRSGDVCGAVWGEIDVEAKLWTIPAARIKAAREHHVPLSDDAMKLLEAMPRGADHEPVFTAPRGGRLYDVALTKVLRRMGIPAEIASVHGMRSTARDWAGEMTAHPREVIEHALAHKLGDATEAAYARGTLLRKRAVLMADWARYCATVPGEAKVLPMAKKRSKTK